MDEIEQLREQLLDAKRARKRERRIRKELESLLEGIPRLTGAMSVDEVLSGLEALLRCLLDFDWIALLEAGTDGMSATAGTGPLAELSLASSPYLQRCLRGRAVVMNDTSAVPEWGAFLAGGGAAVRSALLLPILSGAAPALLVLGSKHTAGFDGVHRRLASRVAPTAGQALLAIRHLELRRAKEQAAAAEAAALDTAGLLDRALEAVDVGLLVLNDGVVFANDTALSLLSKVDMPPERVARHAPRRTLCPECGRDTPAGRQRIHHEDQGTHRVLELTFAGHAHRVRTVRGGDLVLVADVTRWVLAEERLQALNHELSCARDEALAADRAKTQFLSTMSHELRTPLNAIIGYGELLWEEAEAHNLLWILKDLERIQVASEHLLRLIGDVLDIARIDSRALAFRPEEVDLVALVRELVETVQPMAQRQGNEIRVVLEPGCGVVFTDPARLSQVLLNLLSNATKFTQEGVITIVGRVLPGSVELEVRDTGIGIAAEALDEIFLPFTQVDGSYTRVGGSGLGLAICRRLIEIMGGTMGVRSVVGEGSAFWVRLPRSPGPDASPPVG